MTALLPLVDTVFNVTSELHSLGRAVFARDRSKKFVLHCDFFCLFCLIAFYFFCVEKFLTICIVFSSFYVILLVDFFNKQVDFKSTLLLKQAT